MFVFVNKTFLNRQCYYMKLFISTKNSPVILLKKTTYNMQLPLKIADADDVT